MSPRNFLLATRDTGYKSTAHAVAEFVDNSLQAGAHTVAVDVVPTNDQAYPIELRVTDDGKGMDSSELALALTFGGSSRFGDRSSLGRYGMGLPNGAISRARRVEVFSWRNRRVLMTYLDLDDIVAKARATLPPIEVVGRPSFVPRTAHGTVVRLLRCDRLEYKRIAVLAGRLSQDLGRIYRRYLFDGIGLSVNGDRVGPSDPLYLRGDNAFARQFGDVLIYRLGTGTVAVRFSELPVERWHNLPAEDKRRDGITNAPCVSIMRANREIDRGWFFMGAKRRENYDDWWRCEVSFDPSLDELFGITHAKQAICPTQELLRTLEPDLEPVARALNSRVRHRFEMLQVRTALTDAERQAGRAEKGLPALPTVRRPIAEELSRFIDTSTGSQKGSSLPYQVLIADLPSTLAYEVVVHRRSVILVLNSHHPLYRDLYGPLATSESDKDRNTAKQIALAVLAAGRAEVAVRRSSEQEALRRFRRTWADVMAAFFSA